MIVFPELLDISVVSAYFSQFMHFPNNSQFFFNPWSHYPSPPSVQWEPQLVQVDLSWVFLCFLIMVISVCRNAPEIISPIYNRSMSAPSVVCSWTIAAPVPFVAQVFFSPLSTGRFPISQAEPCGSIHGASIVNFWVLSVQARDFFPLQTSLSAFFCHGSAKAPIEFPHFAPDPLSLLYCNSHTYFKS